MATASGSTNRMAQSIQAEPYVIIAIDFGTTYSGVSWTWSGNLDSVQPIRRWTDALNGSDGTYTQAKIPTKIRYRRDRPTSEALWGWNLNDGDDENEITFEWFKLILNYEALEERVKVSPRVKSTFEKLETIYNRGSAIPGAVQITTDYLRLLWKSTVHAMVAKEGYQFFHDLPCKVILTKPAIWSPKACSRTRNAARKAISGNLEPFGRLLALELVSEPEAAALAVLDTPVITQRPDIIKLGDVYLVADCGGGTVDVISYIVRSLDPLRLEECVEGTGDLCGSIFIDDEFEVFMSSRTHIPWESLEPWERQDIMLTQWELGIKQRFSPRPHQTWQVRLRGRRQIYNNNHIEPLFQPACGKARGLIEQQVGRISAKMGRMPKAILLVGGMGSSEYLGFQLRQQYLGEIEIRQSNDDQPWTAVCRGAAMAIASQMNIGRISRCNYGFCYTDTFNPRIHTMNDVTWDYVTKQEIAPVMEWIVRRGDVVQHLLPRYF